MTDESRLRKLTPSKMYSPFPFPRGLIQYVHE